jgi:hypothetical protein
MSGDILLILVLLAAVPVLILIFKLVDSYLNAKPKTKEKPQQKPEDPVPAEKAEKPEIKEVKETVIIRSTKSLADEIEKEIGKEKQQSVSTDRPPNTRIRAHDRIKKFREARHYSAYGDFNAEAAETDGEEEEDESEVYRKMVALAGKPVSRP